MLEQFHVKEEDAVRVQEDALRSTVAQIFQKVNVPAEDAARATDVLVTADVRNVDSHGVSNMLRAYVAGYNSGEINPRPDWRIVRQSPATATIDSDAGLGIIVTPRAMEIAIEKARNVGLGMVTISNGRHLGMASYHAMMALEHDMIGVCMTGCPPSVLPTFGAEPRLGTNPIALAAPAGEEAPFVFDAATSVVAGNKLGLAARLGVDLPAGWVAALDGTPLMEPVPMSPEWAPGEEKQYHQLALGSTRESGSHKGYGLGCIVDILTGPLSGSAFGMVPGRPNFSHMVAAYSIEAFTDVAQFKSLMDDFLRALRTTPPAPGAERVLYPGLPEHEAELERRANGIPLHKEVMEWFKDTCSEMDIPYVLS
jgi:LDH2 family malate/lactate/ureidoglycolate dehydrogenase